MGRRPLQDPSIPEKIRHFLSPVAVACQNQPEQQPLGGVLLHKSFGCSSFSSVGCHFLVMGQTHEPIVFTHNVRKMPQFSCVLNTDFERLKFVTTQLEISRFEYQLLPRLRSQQLRLSFTFYSVQSNHIPDSVITSPPPLPYNFQCLFCGRSHVISVQWVCQLATPTFLSWPLTLSHEAGLS